MNPVHRKTLSKKQLAILYGLYRFRFGTDDLLANYLFNVSRQSMHDRLKVLCEKGYIGRIYNSSYKLAGRPASYHLLPKGIAVLKQLQTGIKPAVLRNIRKDSGASERFVSHCMNVFATYVAFKATCGGA
jgi:DNA-binding MarR family transcriptional regulator